MWFQGSHEPLLYPRSLPYHMRNMVRVVAAHIYDAYDHGVASRIHSRRRIPTSNANTCDNPQWIGQPLDDDYASTTASISAIHSSLRFCDRVLVYIVPEKAIAYGTKRGPVIG